MAYFTASCDSPEKNKDFAKELNLDYPILSDPKGDTARQFGVVDDERKFPRRWTFYIGPDCKLLYIDKDVKAASHGAAVAAKLKELGIESAN